MEQRDGNGSSEHLSLEFDDVTRSSRMRDEDPVDDDKMIERASSSSFSSSSSISTAFELEVDYGENDMIYTEFEGNGSSSPSLNPESPSAAPKFTIESSDLDTLNLSPKQSPPIQLMRQHSGYDPNRIPSSIFAQKDTNDPKWSLASNESLFSIRMGNDSFSLDNGFFISKSGKLNWVDDGVDYSCFTPDNMSPNRPTMVKKATDDERKSDSSNGESEEKEELAETHDQLSSDSESEEESFPSRKGLQLSSPPEESLDSDETAKRNSSFTFPVLAGGSPSKVDAEGSPPPSSTPKGAAEAETAPEAPSTTPEAGGNQWFNCFSCFPICC